MTLTCTNVTLRQKPLRNDRISLYLDYYPAIRNPYTMKMSRREFLGIYIYAKPKNEQQRMFNQDMLNKGKHSVNHVFSSPTSIINFTSKKPSYDDTRRSGRDNELLQRAQNDL